MVLLALALAIALGACGEDSAEREKGEGTETPSTQEEGDRTDFGQEEKERPLYIFVGGQLVGSWEDGGWVSAVSQAGNHPFTMGEILGEDHYWTYEKGLRKGYLIQCECFTLPRELGGFLDEERDTAALLDPYAVYVPVADAGTDRRVFALPVELTGEAAELPVPDYAFYLTFGGTYPDLAVSRQLEDTWSNWRQEGDPDWDSYAAMAEEALADRGLTGPYRLEVAELSGGELVLVINDKDSEDYWERGPEGGKFFNLVLYWRADGVLETVYENIVDFNGELTNIIRISSMGVWDLNGDGTPEICLQDGRWEWGYYYVMARDGDGIWRRVLQADHGM